MGISRLATLWKTAGPGHVCRFVLTRLIRKKQHVVYALDMMQVDEPAWADDTVVHIVATEEQVHVHPLIASNLQRENAQYLEGIRRGEAVGIFVLIDDTLVHWAFVLWGSRTACLLGLGCREVLLGNAFTEPAFRGRGLQTHSLRQRIIECKRLGVERVYTETEPDNWPSRRAMERVGMSRLREVFLVIVLSRLVFRVTRSGSRARFIGIC